MQTCAGYDNDSTHMQNAVQTRHLGQVTRPMGQQQQQQQMTRLSHLQRQLDRQV